MVQRCGGGSEQVDPVVLVQVHRGLLPVAGLGRPEACPPILALADLRADFPNTNLIKLFDRPLDLRLACPVVHHKAVPIAFSTFPGALLGDQRSLDQFPLAIPVVRGLQRAGGFCLYFHFRRL